MGRTAEFTLGATRPEKPEMCGACHTPIDPNEPKRETRFGVYHPEHFND